MFGIYHGDSVGQNLKPYYHIDTKEKKKLLIEIAEKHGILIDKPKTRVPFYISMEAIWGEGKSYNFLVEKTFDEELFKYGYCIAPFENIEEDAIICFKPELLQGCTQFEHEIFSSGTFNRFTSKLYRANGDRWFKLSNDHGGSFHAEFCFGGTYNYRENYKKGNLRNFKEVAHKKLDLIDLSEAQTI